MDGTHPNQFDKRPKRRRDKDNPYELFSVGADTQSPSYYIRFSDGQGAEHCLEIEKRIYDLLNRFELDDLRFLNEYDRHHEHLELSEQQLHERSATEVDSVEDTVLRRLEHVKLHIAIRRLSEKQRRRLMLHYFGGYKIQEIANMEECDQSVISRSITAAEKKLKKYLTE